MTVRAADPSEVHHLAELWYAGWRDAHARIVPEALVRVRTRESFHERMRAALPAVRVIGPAGTPAGFHLIKADELEQLYVASEARGTGLASVLIADAEDDLARAGIRTAWLACAIGNHRAARFYEKSGWRLAGTVTNHLETPIGPFPLDVWRYEKRLHSLRA